MDRNRRGIANVYVKELAAHLVERSELRLVHCRQFRGVLEHAFQVMHHAGVSLSLANRIQ